MSGAEEAKQMLRMSGKDLSALKGMLEAETFSEEIFGFHAQQAVEKTLKAWITFLGAEHTFKHDLRQLVIKLRELGIDVTDLWEFVDLNSFAVQFRYEAYVYTDEPLDRQDTIIKIQALYDKVKGIIERFEQ